MRRTSAKDEIVQLAGDSGTFIIQICDPIWARCYYRSETNKIYLGAHTPKTLVGRLLNTVIGNRKCNIVGELSGYPVCWVLSLSEAHFTLYIAKTHQRRVLFCEDSKGKLVASLTLLPVHIAQWQSILKPLSKSLW